jgi:hypothetical protein
MVKTQLESTDLIPTGTRDSGYGGSYKPTMIKYSDLASQILSGVPPLTIGTTPIVSGSVGKLLYEGAGNVLNESPIFNIDPLTGFLGAGTSTPQYAIDMQFNTLGFYSAPNYYAYLGLNNGSFYLSKESYDILIERYLGGLELRKKYEFSHSHREEDLKNPLYNIFISISLIYSFSSVLKSLVCG